MSSLVCMHAEHNTLRTEAEPDFHGVSVWLRCGRDTVNLTMTGDEARALIAQIEAALSPTPAAHATAQEAQQGAAGVPLSAEKAA